MATTTVLVCMVHVYHIRSTFGGDFNLVVWWFWLQLPNLMYINTTYNHVYYEFVLRSDLPNLMFAKYTVYTVCEHELLKNSCKFVNIFY